MKLYSGTHYVHIHSTVFQTNCPVHSNIFVGMDQTICLKYRGMVIVINHVSLTTVYKELICNLSHTFIFEEFTKKILVMIEHGDIWEGDLMEVLV